MIYEKQNFTDGQTLTAQHLNHIEDGVLEISEKAASLEAGKQNVLTSGVNIKTINGQSILGSGDIEIERENVSVYMVYENGSIDTSGKNVAYQGNIPRMRTTYFNISGVKTIYVNIGSSYVYGWHLYDANMGHVRSAASFETGYLELYVSDASYVRFNFKETTNASFTYEDILTAGFSVKMEKNSVIGYTTGGIPSKYIGRINFESNFKYKKYITGYTPTASLPSTTQQGMSIYNDKAFLLYNGGGLAILDLKTREAVSEFALDTAGSSNHCNSCNFSNDFYTGNTVYPLLYISECYGEHRCFVENITDSGSELVQTISFDNRNGDYSHATFGVAFDWILDNETSLLMTYGVMSDGRHKIKVFHKPDIAASSVTFTEDDVIDQWVVEDAFVLQSESNFVYQGNCAKNGTIYLITYNPNKILCIDAKTHAITAEVDTSFITAEPEDIAIQSDTMFVATAGSCIFAMNFD